MLLKHGEDLRQDERIMQLLHTMDVALRRDVACRKRNLRIHTYKVKLTSSTESHVKNLILRSFAGRTSQRILWVDSMGYRYRDPKALPRNGSWIPKRNGQVKQAIFLLGCIFIF